MVTCSAMVRKVIGSSPMLGLALAKGFRRSGQATSDSRGTSGPRSYALSLMEPHAAYTCSFRAMRRVSAVGLGLCLAIVATAAYASGSNQPTLIAALNGEPEPEQQQHGPFKPYYSGIAASGTLFVWSDWQPGDRRWHLIMRRSGQISVLPTPTGSRVRISGSRNKGKRRVTPAPSSDLRSCAASPVRSQPAGT